MILDDKEMDLGAIGVTMNFKHYSQQNIDISVPIISEPYKLVVPWPKYESRLFAPIRPFQPLVSCPSRTIFKGINS